MNIKARLKELGITLGVFADALEISRPTLDSYILTFENGEDLPKEKYHIAFDLLFNHEIEDRDEFLSLLENLHEMIERDKKYGVMDYCPEHTDLMNSIFSSMKKDFNSEDFDINIYVFINMLINSYKDDPYHLFKRFAQYFMILNGQLEVDAEDDEQRLFLSNAYKLFGGLKENELSFDQIYYRKFLKRVDEVRNANTQKEDDIQKIIERKVKEEIQKRLKLGFEIDDIDFDDVMRNIKLND